MTGALVFGILLPGLASAAAWGVGWRLWRRAAEPIAGGEWSGAPAVALACVTGFLALYGWPRFPPTIAEDWLPYVAVVGGVVGAAAIRSRRLRVALWVVMSAVALGLVLGSQRSSWSAAESIAWSVALLAAAIAVLATVDLIASRRPGPALPLTLWIWCSGLAATLALTGCAKYGQFVGFPAAALGSATIAALWKPGFSLAKGAPAVLVPWNVALIACGYFYAYLPAGHAILMAVAPMTLWIGETGWVTRLGRRGAAAARIAGVAIPVAAAVAIAAWPHLFPPSNPWE